MPHNGIRALTGLVSVAVVVAVVAVAVGLFQGSFTDTTPVTVLSPRAGLVMNPDAKVKMHGVQVGKVASIESRPDGQAVLRLAMYPSEMHLIPANVLVDLTSPTVFGAKFVELVAPAEPSAQSLHAGQVLDSQHVTVEVNTVFKQLTSVLGTLDPAKLNETLGAVSQALSGRGEKIGQAFSDLDSFLAKFDPSLPALSHDIAMSAPVFRAYGDASADLMKTLDNSVKISKTIVDEQRNLDALLISAIGLADVGNDVLGANRYPQNLPKVAATGGPHCMNLPRIPFNSKAKVLIADTGSNPVVYGNPQVLLNFDGLKQLLYGPIDGPPRNPAQVGQQG